MLGENSDKTEKLSFETDFISLMNELGKKIKLKKLDLKLVSDKFTNHGATTQISGNKENKHVIAKKKRIR